MRQTYFINLCHQTISSTYFRYCTIGILLRQLHNDPMLDGVTHVVVDEVRRLPKQHWNIQCGDIGIFSVVGSEKLYTEKFEKASPCYAEI